jgi:hypothetical protein
MKQKIKRFIGFFLHNWNEIGGFITEGTVFTRQRCGKCDKTRVQPFFRKET